MTPFQFDTTASIVFGEGASARIGEIAAARLGHRLLVVTDPGLVRLGLIAPALASLGTAGLAFELFSDVVADPPGDRRDGSGRRRDGHVG